MRFDDTQSRSGITAFETGPNYVFANDGPIVLGLYFNNINNEVIRNNANDDLFAIDAIGGEMRLRNIGNGGVEFGRGGGFSVFNGAGAEVFRIGGNGNVEEINNFNDEPKFVEGHTYKDEDLTTRSPSSTEVARHDGSDGSFSASLCFESGGSWYNLVDGTTM